MRIDSICFFLSISAVIASSAVADSVIWISEGAELAVSTTDGESTSPDRASDRYLVVTTSATNVAVGLDGTNAQTVRFDQLTDERLVVSQRDGSLANADTIGIAVSPDGRYVAMVTEATNLLAAPTTGRALLRKDMVTGDVVRIPYQAKFLAISNASFQASGRHLQFVGLESEWIVGSPDRQRVIVIDFVTGSVTALPVAQEGEVGHLSRGANCFVYGTATGRVILHLPGGTEVPVDVPQGGGSPNDSTIGAQVSDDCRFVVFGSRATNLLPTVTTPESVYRFDALSQSLEWVSINESVETDSGLDFIRMSPDARHVYYLRNVIPGGLGLVANYRWKYRDMLATTLTSFARQDVVPSGIDTSGAFLVGTSSPFGLDRNDLGDVQISAGPLAIPQLVMGSVNTTLASSPNGSSNRGELVARRSHTREGRLEYFVSNASNLVPGAPTDLSGQSLFVRDTDFGTTLRLLPTGPTPLDGIIDLADVSSDGRFVLFSSTASSHVMGDTNQQRDLFLLDRTTNAIERINVSAGGLQSDLEDIFPSSAAVSDDGQRVVFQSLGRTLSGALSAQRIWYLRDRSEPTTRLLYPKAIGMPQFSQLSADGREIVYEALSDCQHWILNLDSQARSCASLSESGANLAVPSTFSRDLRFVLYATNEAPQRVLLRDRKTGHIRVLPIASGDIQLTGDGRYVIRILQAAGEHRARIFDTLIGSDVETLLPIEERRQLSGSTPQGPWLMFWSKRNLSGTDQNRLTDLYRATALGDGIHGGGWQGGFE